MKIIIQTVKLCALSLVLMLGAFAADLRNEDGKRYEVKVHEGSTTRNTWIDGNSTVIGICSSCEVEVVGIGKVKISGSDRLVIKDGKLLKQ
jgi:hypothetical protein